VEALPRAVQAPELEEGDTEQIRIRRLDEAA
jgi:hypothetical protein